MQQLQLDVCTSQDFEDLGSLTAAMKNVLSPNSLTMIIIRDEKKASTCRDSFLRKVLSGGMIRSLQRSCGFFQARAYPYLHPYHRLILQQQIQRTE